jgi:hypothetical protein
MVCWYQLPANTKNASLNIYDVQDRLVQSNLLQSGQTFIQIDGSSLNNGVYFYGIEAEGLVFEKKKLVVLH